jgi:signal transduction histidine kinase
VQDSSQLVTRNLRRAAELITSFKHVAVDQTSSQRREFDLGEVLREVVGTLHHTFRKTPYTLDIDVPEGILMDSYPGPLGQVATNLINNALTHGFEGRDHGRMLFRVRPVGTDRVDIEFSDDGKGIPADNLKHVFDPFFTTRLGQGGSGLGLNITYNIIEGLLGGSIRVTSEPGQGTHFVIEIPLKAP